MLISSAFTLCVSVSTEMTSTPAAAAAASVFYIQKAMHDVRHAWLEKSGRSIFVEHYLDGLRIMRLGQRQLEQDTCLLRVQ